LSFWTSALKNEEKSQWVWTATGQSVNWAAGEPRFKEGEGQALLLASDSHKMVLNSTILNKNFQMSYYICEKSTIDNGLRNSQMKWKSCSAGSDWTCHNEVTGCYCHQTIKVCSSFSLFNNPRIDLFHPIDRGIGRMPPNCAILSA
jgi:hypothetical protein